LNLLVAVDVADSLSGLNVDLKLVPVHGIFIPDGKF